MYMYSGEMTKKVYTEVITSSIEGHTFLKCANSGEQKGDFN